MRIGINLEQLLYRVPGGTGRYTARLAGELAVQEGIEVVPFTAAHRMPAVSAALAGYDLGGLGRPVRIPLPRPVLYDAWHVAGFPALSVLPGLRGLDLVHAPYLAVPPVGGVPLVVSIHDAGYALFPEAYPKRGRIFHRRGAEAAARRAAVVLTGTRAAAEEIAGNTPIPAGRIRVIPYGADQQRAAGPEVARALEGLGLAGAPYVLWVGTTEPRKGLATLLEAFSTIAGRTELPHRLVLVGPQGWLVDGLLPPQHRSALGERLRMTGHVDDATLRCLYAGAALFALPSRHEGFGIPVLEAMVQGTPVICSDIPALREVAGGRARLVAPGDTNAWADALVDMLSDETELERASADGQRWAGGFTWERTARETAAVYRELAASR